jgi:superfamily II DNA/RNA helicase
VDELRRLSPSARDTETEKKRSLATCASRGVVWHHSALRAEEKALVEKGFREGAFRVVCCTTTMATGVNLPAKRVVVATPYVYRKKPALHEVLKARDLQQMVGRAGRAGFGADVGDAFVVCPRAADVRWTRSLSKSASSSSAVSVAPQKNAKTDAPSDARALALEMAARLSSDGEALSSTIAQAGMRRVMLEAVACGLARGTGRHQGVHTVHAAQRAERFPRRRREGRHRRAAVAVGALVPFVGRRVAEVAADAARARRRRRAPRPRPRRRRRGGRAARAAVPDPGDGPTFAVPVRAPRPARRGGRRGGIDVG